jgi:hypothetical protein
VRNYEKQETVMKSLKKRVATAILSAFLMGVTGASFADITIKNDCKFGIDVYYYSVTTKCGAHIKKIHLGEGDTKSVTTVDCKYNISPGSKMAWGATCPDVSHDGSVKFKGKSGFIPTCNCEKE